MAEHEYPGAVSRLRVTLVAAGVLVWSHLVPESLSGPGGWMECAGLRPVEAQAAESLPPGMVRAAPERQQMAGVEYGEVTEGPVVKKIVTVGRLAGDETRVAHIHTRVEGWIVQSTVDFVGKRVKKGDPLASIYSPELVATQQELLLAKKAKESLADSGWREVSAGSLSLYRSTCERLRLWDISEAQIREIEKRGTPETTLTLFSPINGFVVTRNAFPGLRVTPETELYSIVDLSTIWVLADIYDYEIPMVQIGQKATMTLTSFPGETFTGKVTHIYPQRNSETRTLGVRLEFPNRDFKLKPDMYANVELTRDLGTRISVPTEAVLDAGMEQVVFVVHEGGALEPRKVVIGPRLGDRIIIQSGVKPGERIVTSANFLIDSESKLQPAVDAMVGHGGGAGGAK